MSTEFCARESKNTQARTAALETAGPIGSQPAASALGLQSTAGNQAVQRLLKARLLQAKLQVSQPGDVYEQEADQVAETVMRMPQAAGEGTPPGPAPHLFRSSQGSSPAPEISGDLESSVLAQTSGGQPLPPSTRDFFESRLNSDFSNVRVHTDPRAAESTQSIGARAYTLGNHIVFGNAEYSPDSTAGRKLLAHELVHVIQQGGSAQAIQRKLALNEVDTSPAPTPSIIGPTPSASTALATGGGTVHTDWFVDFWGVANNGRKKGRGDRDPGDVLILEDFTIGPKDDPKTFPKVGDAQKAGYSRIGSYEHPRGPASAFGTVSYANRRELDVKLSWDGQKKRETNPAALAAARQTVEKLILHPSDISGDWNAVESRAADAAAEHLPDGSNPKVEIQWHGSHQEYSLNTVDYEVRNPALCTAYISVPTTSSAIDWATSDTEQHDNRTQTHDATQTHVDTDIATGHASSEKHASASLLAGKDHNKDAWDAQHVTEDSTHTEATITWEEIEQSSRHLYIGLSESMRVAWLNIIKKLEREPGAKTIQEDEEKDLGWTGKVKKWFKDRGHDVYDWAKEKVYGKVKSFLSGKVVGWLKKILITDNPEAWWIPVLEWGGGWAVGKLADKVRGWIWGKKGEDQRVPPASGDLPQLTTTERLYDDIRNNWLSAESSTDVEKGLSVELRKIYDHYEGSSSNISHEESKDRLAARARADATSEANTVQTRVRTAVDHQGGTDTDEGKASSITRAYHGTTIKVTAGQPLLTIKIQEKP